MGTLDEWLTVKEAAEFSGYHENHIRRLLRGGGIQCRKWGNAWMVNRESLLEYLKKSRAQGEKTGPKRE